MSEEKHPYHTKAQTIFRTAKNPDNPYVMIDRRVIENPNLSWKAKGLLAYLLSRPDNWTVRFRDLVKRSPDGAHTVRVALGELRKAGHVQVETIREDGRVKQWIYTVHENPSPDGEFQQVEIQQVENRTFNNNDSTNNKKYGADAPNEKVWKIGDEELPVDWQVGLGKKLTTGSEEELFLKQARDAANLIEQGCAGGGELAYAFMVTRGIILPQSDAKGQRKAAKEMLVSKVKAKHVVEATRQLMEARDKRGKPLTVVNLFSVRDTAIGIANQPPPAQTPQRVIHRAVPTEGIDMAEAKRRGLIPG